MKDYIEERAVDIGKYIIETKATVREAAKVFKVSKSTVHKDVAERLPKINPIIFNEVKKILDKNKAERHIRGGKATKMKYKMRNL
ncbi:MAG: sporulation transcriptional regulator SpoIIID [Mahellales bacterium]